MPSSKKKAPDDTAIALDRIDQTVQELLMMKESLAKKSISRIADLPEGFVIVHESALPDGLWINEHDGHHVIKNTHHIPDYRAAHKMVQCDNCGVYFEEGYEEQTLQRGADEWTTSNVTHEPCPHCGHK